MTYFHVGICCGLKWFMKLKGNLGYFPREGKNRAARTQTSAVSCHTNTGVGHNSLPLDTMGSVNVVQKDSGGFMPGWLLNRTVQI